MESEDSMDFVRKEERRYMPALDGLRAMAVMAVVIYHLNPSWAPGGLLGVCLFFVLSGYLITDLLIAEWDRSGYINLKNFWLRRMRRLLPVLFTVLAAVMVWIAFFAPERLGSVGKDALAATFYTSNWWYIFHQVSYFESFGPPSPLGHLWSLAIEEQFYLLWPLLLSPALHYLPRRGRIITLTIGLASLSAAAMAFVYQPGLDPSRVYYGTDTRAFALLIGAALAFVWPSRKLSFTLSRKQRVMLEGAGGLGSLTVIGMMGTTNQYQPFLYQGGLLIFSLAAAVLVAVLAHPTSTLGRFFSLKPLRWTGVISYGIYLWHYPVIALTAPVVNAGGFDVKLALGQLSVTIILAGLSWYFIEEPIRHGKKPWRNLRLAKRREWPLIFSKVALFTVIIFFSPSCMVIDGNNTPALQEKDMSSVSPTQNISDTPGVIYTSGISDTSGIPDTSDIPDTSETPGSPENPGTADKDTKPMDSKTITVIGDSLMINVEPELKKIFPEIVIDAKIGRQMYQAPDVISEFREQGKLGEIVIIELGTNGSFTEKQLREMLDSLGETEQIILVNTRVPRPWEGLVNQTFAQVVKDYPKAVLLDWYSASSGHNEYFYQDGVHLNQVGAQVYASLVRDVVN